MNHSIYGADRTTHLKIADVALAAGIATASIAVVASINSHDQHTQAARIIKAGKPVTVTRSNALAGFRL